MAIAIVLALAGAAGLWLLWAPTLRAPELAAAPPPAPAPAPEPYLPQSAGQPPSQQPGALPVLPEGDADPTRDLSSYLARGERPTMAQVIDGLHQRGIHSGLGAFLPPGTSPPLVGLAVPEDFALPKGYVRHHQATDDGQRIEAILMFAPDFQLTGPNGQPLAMPANRVVPPELAPPGLPIRRIVIPPPNDPNNPSR
ncbi:hypothetical protein KY495_18180 [Massilia sp. PAMC28688]|nr:hypothetical protein KY495_18180 [Massilia sp. PAMC28688]